MVVANEYIVKFKISHWMNWLAQAIQKFFRSIKIHDYSQSADGSDYVFEKVAGDGRKGYMTAQKRGVKIGDRVLLFREGKLEEYYIQELNYYSSPNDMWIALLMKLNR